MRTLRALAPGLAMALSLVIAGCGKAPQAEEPLPEAVRVQPATLGPASQPVHASGVLVPQEELRLAFKVGGVIQRIEVKAGQRVRAGQLLAEIEQTEIQAEVEQARQLAEQARRDLQRGESLHADQVIPLEQLEQLRTQAGVAAARLRAAEYNARLTRLVAPADATVLRRIAEPRDLVPAGQVVLVLGGSGAGLAVRAAVSDREIARLAPGDAATVQVDAHPGVKLAARVSEVAGAADERNGLFTVEAALEPQELPLRAGMVARLSIEPASDGAQRVHVPVAAIVEADGGTASIFVLDGEHARRREVRVAWIGADSVALEGGVDAGEQVIVAGAPFLDDGEAVRVLP